MEQMIPGGFHDLIHVTDTEYNSLVGGTLWNAVEAQVRKVVSTNGVIKYLWVKLSAFPGAGTHYDFTLIVNGNPTALTVEIAEFTTTASDMVSRIAVTPDDTVSIQCDPDNNPTPRYAYWSVVFESDEPNESLIMGGSSAVLNNGATEYGQIMCARTDYSNVENDFRQVIPTSGTIKDFYVKLSEDPGTAPDAYRLTVRLNGATVAQSLIVTITADDTTGSDLVHNLAVAAGNVLTMMIEPLNGPSATPFACWGMTFVADIDGESIVMGGKTEDLDPAATEYTWVTGYESSPWAPAATNAYQLTQSCSVKNLYILLSSAPGVGNEYQFTLKTTGGATFPELVATVTGAATTGNSGAVVDPVADNSYLDLEVVPISAPDAADAYWGFVVYIPALSPYYTHKIATFAIGADAAWTDYDLFTNQGVPKGAIAEIVCCNKNVGVAREAGVRTDGSTAGNRYIYLHEAEGDGVHTVTMFVKCHETTGLIECYSEIQGDIDFYLLGYFEGVDFTEAFVDLGAPGTAWANKDLSGSSVPASAVCQIMMANGADAADYFAGVRAVGSELERGVTLDEAEDGAKDEGLGWTVLSMVVKANVSSIIEWKCGSATYVNMWLLGWFGDSVEFVEGFTEYSPTGDNTWESKTITEAVASSVVAFAMVHEDSGVQQVTGLRAEGSGLARQITEHEAEGGSNTGFQACVSLDGLKKCQVYGTDASEANNYYTGYFIISVVEGVEYFQTIEDVLGMSDALPSPIGTFKKSVTDILGMVESSPSVGSFHLTASDQLGLFDVVAPRADFRQQFVDQLGLLDSVSFPLHLVVAEILGLSDSVVKRADFKVEAIDIFGLVDSAATQGTLHITVSDQLGLIDTLAARSDLRQTVTEILSLLDSTTLRGDYKQIVIDILGQLDSTAIRSDYQQAVSETLGLLDDVEGRSALKQAITEILGLLETTPLRSDRKQAVAETLGLLDSVAKRADLKQEVVDVLGLLDALWWAEGVAYYVTIMESLGLLDATTLRSDQKQVVMETLGILDAVVLRGDYKQIVTEILSQLDSVMPRADRQQVISETLGLFDATETQKTLRQIITESLEFLETTALRSDQKQAVTEILGMLDTATLRSDYKQVIIDYLGIVDVIWWPIIRGIVMLRFAQKEQVLEFVEKEKMLTLAIKETILDLADKIRKLRLGRKET